jgi:hypothetical protein
MTPPSFVTFVAYAYGERIASGSPYSRYDWEVSLIVPSQIAESPPTRAREDGKRPRRSARRSAPRDLSVSRNFGTPRRSGLPTIELNLSDRENGPEKQERKAYENQGT